MSVSTPLTAMPPTPPVPLHEAPSLPLPPPPSAPQQHQQHPVVYRLIFPDLVASFREGRYGEVIGACEEAEIFYPDVRERPTRLLITIPLVLSYLCTDTLPPAKFALARLPRVLQSFAPIRVLHELLGAVHDRRYAAVYALADALVASATGSLKEDAELDLAISPMVSLFLQNYRARVLGVLERAYTVLRVGDGEGYLGLSGGEVILACKSARWTYDEPTSTLRPPPSAQRQRRWSASNGFAPSTMLQFAGIVDGAAKLEWSSSA